MLGLDTNSGRSLAYLVPYTLAAVALWIVHFGIWKAGGERAEMERKETKLI